MDDNRRLFNMVYKILIKYFDKDAANEKYIEGVLRERPS